MEIDDSDFGCLGIPTPLEMWKQQCVLLATEIEEHLVDLRQCRGNIAKLVEINATLTSERDQLQGELGGTKTKLSDAYRELATVKNTLNGYAAWQSRLTQAEAAKQRSGE